MVALLTSVRNSPCFGGLRRTKTCHRQLFSRPSVFLRYFLHAAKSTNPFSLSGVPRFSKPRFSSPQWRLRTNKIKTFPKRSFEVLQTSNQHTKPTLRTNPMKSFAAPRLISALRRRLCGFAAFSAAMPPLKLSISWKVCPIRGSTLRVHSAAFGGIILVAAATIPAAPRLAKIRPTGIPVGRKITV